MPLTIGDLVPKVKLKLGGRTDINARITEWLMDAYREIAMAYDFETLETSTSDICSPGSDTYLYPPQARALKSVVLMNGSTPVPIRKKNIQVVRRYQTGNPGLPALWAPFGNSYILRPAPNKGYPILLDFWRKPDFGDETEATVNAVLVELPDDWIEILKLSATERGHAGLIEFDKSQAIHQVLHGDPDPNKGNPGLLKQHGSRNNAENQISDYGFRPRIRRYTS